MSASFASSCAAAQLKSYGFVLGVALLEGESDFVCFSGESDNHFAILSVKLSWGTTA